MVESGYDINQLYQQSLSTIKYYTGLKDLSLIEKVALRRIATGALERLALVESAHHEFPPVSETVAIFLNDYYDCPATTQSDVSFLLRTRINLFQERGYDALGEFFQKKQEEKHHP